MFVGSRPMIYEEDVGELEAIFISRNTGWSILPQCQILKS